MLSLGRGRIVLLLRERFCCRGGPRNKPSQIDRGVHDLRPFRAGGFYSLVERVFGFLKNGLWGLRLAAGPPVLGAAGGNHHR